MNHSGDSRARCSICDCEDVDEQVARRNVPLDAAAYTAHFLSREDLSTWAEIARIYEDQAACADEIIDVREGVLATLLRTDPYTLQRYNRFVGNALKALQCVQVKGEPCR